MCTALSGAGREYFHKSWLVSDSIACIHACNVGRGESVAAHAGGQDLCVSVQDTFNSFFTVYS